MHLSHVADLDADDIKLGEFLLSTCCMGTAALTEVLTINEDVLPAPTSNDYAAEQEDQLEPSAGILAVKDEPTHGSEP